LTARAESLAEQPTKRETVQRLDRLVASPGGILPRIDERREPLDTLRVTQRTRESEDAGEHRERTEHPQARAGGEVHRERDRADDDGGTEIRLGEDECPDDARDE